MSNWISVEAIRKPERSAGTYRHIQFSCSACFQTHTVRFDDTGVQAVLCGALRFKQVSDDVIQLQIDTEYKEPHEKIQRVRMTWEASPNATCPECGGTGEIDLSVGPERIVTCKHCDGTGEVDETTGPHS